MGGRRQKGGVDVIEALAPTAAGGERRSARSVAGGQAGIAPAEARWLPGIAIVAALAGAALLFWPSPQAATAASSPPLAAAAEPPPARTAPPVPLGSAAEPSSLQLTATLGQGDSFGRMLQRAGVGSGEAARIAALVATEVPLAEIAPGTRFALTLGSRESPARPRPVQDLSFRARLDLDLAVERRGAGFAVVRKPIAVERTRLRIRGIVGASLYRSARAAGAPPSSIQQYLRAIDRHLSLERDIQPSDQFDIVVEQARAASGEVATGDLLYAGLDRGGRPQAQLLRWADGRFYAASGLGERLVGLDAPVAGPVSSGYGLRRHPILGYARMHRGVDFMAPWGSPIHAAADGTVSYAGYRGGHGNYVRLAHGDGMGSGYGHMSRIAVAPGMRVRRGEVIGYVGSTGLSTGPHLHYELYLGGRAIDPVSLGALFSPERLEGAELAAFRARLAEVRALRPASASRF